MITPRIDHHAHPFRRADLEGGTCVEGNLDRAVMRRRLVGLDVDHPVVVAGHLPDVQAGIDIGHGRILVFWSVC